MPIKIIDGIPVIVSNRNNDIPDGVKLVPVKKRRKKAQPLAILKANELQELTIRQRVALKHFFSGKSKGDSAKLAGFSSISPINKALKTVAGNEAFINAMNEAGITNDSLANVLAEGLKAEHPFKKNRKDWHAIHKFFDSALKVTDAYAATKVKGETDHRHIHIHLTKDDDEQAERYAKMRGIDIEAEVIQES